jgi:hypothetical protein
MLDSRWTEIARYTQSKKGLPGYAVLIEYFVRNYEYSFVKRSDGTTDYHEKSISTAIRYRVIAVNKNDFTDYPVQFDDGRIAYDFPERFPKYVKELAGKCFAIKAKLTSTQVNDPPIIEDKMTKKEREKQESIRIAKLDLKYMIKRNSPIYATISHVSSQGELYYRLYAIRKAHKGLRKGGDLVDITDEYAIASQWPFHVQERKHNALYIRSSPGNNIERHLESMGIKVGNRVYL